VWLQSGESNFWTMTLAGLAATLSAAPVYKTVKWLFMEISNISEGVAKNTPANVQLQFASKLRIVTIALYVLCYIIIGFNTFSCLLMTSDFEPNESWAWFYSNLGSLFFSTIVCEPGILVAYWLYEVYYADVQEEPDILSSADVQLNQVGPQLGGLGLRFAASAMRDGLQSQAPDEISEPEEPDAMAAPPMEAEPAQTGTPRRTETPRRPQTPMEAMPAPVPMLALEQVPEPETPEMTPLPPTPPPAAAAMQEIQRMRQELKERAERARKQVQVHAAQQQQARSVTAGAAARGLPGSAALPALAALRPLRPAGDAGIAADRLSGLMAQRRDHPSRADRLQRLALSPFARNASAMGAPPRSAVGSSPAAAAVASGSPDGGAGVVPTMGQEMPGAILSPAAQGARGASVSRGGSLPPLQAVPRSSPRRFGSPRGSPGKAASEDKKPAAEEFPEK